MSNAIAIALMLAISLDDAITRAIARSPELRALEASVAEARATASLSDAFRPAASIGTTPGYATGLPTAVLGQVPAIATIEAHRLFYDRSAQAERLAMMSEVDAAMARLESRKRDIAMNVAELYARAAADSKLIASAERRVTAYDTIASRTDALRREGRARDI
ncbi:MAG TPA: TolC family protein, partial [Thermoanaerobaculia bacterium]